MPGVVPAEVGRTLVSDPIRRLLNTSSPKNDQTPAFKQSKILLIAQGRCRSHGPKPSSERLGAHASKPSECVRPKLFRGTSAVYATWFE